MSVIILLLIASMSVSAIFLCAFIWSAKNHQFDDDYSPPVRILFDDGTTGFEKNEGLLQMDKTETIPATINPQKTK